MTAPLRIITTKYGRVEFYPWGACSYIKGLKQGVPAAPHPEMADYREIAARCGYGADTLRFCQHHEVAHLLVEEYLHNCASRVLWGLARKQPLHRLDAVYEELAAQALQRFAMTGERPIVSAPWIEMRDRFLELLDTEPAR